MPLPLSPRQTRQGSKAPAARESISVIDLTTPEPSPVKAVALQRSEIAVLPASLTPSLVKLRAAEHSLLQKKQSLLRSHELDIPPGCAEHAAAACAATLVLAQEEAGTAVCVSADGKLLTCSHCVAESADELNAAPRERWLLFASGRAVKAVCVLWDPRRDLALLQIVAAQEEEGQPSGSAAGLSFPFVLPASASPPPNAKLMCVGHPGSEDLEAARPGRKTNYDVLHVSSGAFRGYARGQDLHNNSEIGALKHDCWTYWGHSGAPLIERRTGRLVGLHSSWDEHTGMRRGIPLEAIEAFLSEAGA